MAEFAATVPRISGEVFLILAYDGDDSDATRDALLESHLTYVEQHCNDYLACGPLRKPGESQLCGSFFLLAAEDEAAARELVAGDPYVKSGMYKDIQVLSATVAAGRMMGGVIWESAETIRAAATSS